MSLSILKGEVRGFDVGPCNLLLNHLAKKEGRAYDDGGNLAKAGTVDGTMFADLKQIEQQSIASASLGAEWFDKNILPVIDRHQGLALKDQLRTATEYVADIISGHHQESGTTLVTGGGALNEFLIERITALSTSEIVIPSREIIDMKEAICFAFLGLLRMLEVENIIASSTGANRNSIAGAVYLP